MKIAGKKVDGDVTGLSWSFSPNGIQVCGTVRVTADGEPVLTKPLCYEIPLEDLERGAERIGDAAESAWKRLTRWVRKRFGK